MAKKKRKKLGVKKDYGVIFIGFNYLAQAVLKWNAATSLPSASSLLL